MVIGRFPPGIHPAAATVLHAAGPAPAAAAFRPMVSAPIANRFIIRPFPLPLLPSGPLASTQNGNLFTDRSNTGVHWYVPGFALADEPDGLFAFAATKSGLDSQGNPLCSAKLAFALKKIIPPDVANFKTANPNVQLKEISLGGWSATISLAYRDDKTGTAQTLTVPGMAVPMADGHLQIGASGFVGPSVLILYQELASLGGASVAIGASYSVWAMPGSTTPLIMDHAFMLRAMTTNTAFTAARPPTRIFLPATMLHPVAPPPKPPAPPPTPAPTSQPRHFGTTIALGQKYGAGAYQLRYTIEDSGKTRTIVGIDDLKSFNTPQSEFIPLKSLGDVASKYPSLSGLYLGVLSRVIVAVPARYGVVRAKTYCAASCFAVVDSSAQTQGACKFQFAFTLAPDVSAVELLRLAGEIATHSEIKDCTLQLPSFLDDKIDAALQTSFASTIAASRGTEPHSLVLSVEIRDDGANMPAVANANLLLSQIGQSHEPYLTGSVKVKLDPAGTTVSSAIVLNFKYTADAEEGDGLGIAPATDPTAKVALQNDSSFPLLLSRAATSDTVYVLNTVLPAGQSFTTTIAPPAAGAVLTIDRELAVPDPISKADLLTYIAFQTQDVQDVRYVIGINASGIGWDSHGIAGISVTPSITALAQLVVPPLNLAKLNTLASASISVPLQYAVSALTATMAVTLTFADTAKAPMTFSLANDFLTAPIFVLTEAAIAAALT
jgi:hypothetical protein